MFGICQDGAARNGSRNEHRHATKYILTGQQEEMSPVPPPTFAHHCNQRLERVESIPEFMYKPLTNIFNCSSKCSGQFQVAEADLIGEGDIFEGKETLGSGGEGSGTTMTLAESYVVGCFVKLLMTLRIIVK